MISVLRATFLRRLRFWWLVIAAMLLMATFANPRIRLTQDSFRYVFVFDITQSMYVQDVGERDRAISRIAQAKTAARKTISALPCGSQVALGVFTQHRSYLLITPVEICANFDELTRMLDRIHTRMAWRSRSEIAKGIYSAMRMTAELKNEARLIFFTDGHEAPPVNFKLRPRFETAAYGVRGVIVGVGGSTPRPIPKFDRSARPDGNWLASEVMQIDPYSRGRDTDPAGESMVGVDYSDVVPGIEMGREHLSALRQPYLRRLAREFSLEYRRLDSATGLAEYLKHYQVTQRKLLPSDVRWLFAGLALLMVIATYLYRPSTPSRRGG